MCATAMDSDRLKAVAGVSRVGRKQKHHVMHLMLSYSPDEADELTKDEMVRAANGAIRALGAEDHQALIVAHDDEPQPHVHVVINTVSPEDGRLLPAKYSKLKLSRWAQGYEAERGRILCDQRVINNAARDRGVFCPGEERGPASYLRAASGQQQPA